MNQPVAVNDMPIWIQTMIRQSLRFRASRTYNDCTREKDGTTSPAIHKNPRGKRSEQVDDSVDTSHEDSLSAYPSCLLKHGGGVVRDDVDAVLSL